MGQTSFQEPWMYIQRPVVFLISVFTCFLWIWIVGPLNGHNLVKTITKDLTQRTILKSIPKQEIDSGAKTILIELKSSRVLS